jgi:hypothetical protein
MPVVKRAKTQRLEMAKMVRMLYRKDNKVNGLRAAYSTIDAI